MENSCSLLDFMDSYIVSQGLLSSFCIAIVSRWTPSATCAFSADLEDLNLIVGTTSRREGGTLFNAVQQSQERLAGNGGRHWLPVLRSHHKLAVVGRGVWLE